MLPTTKVDNWVFSSGCSCWSSKSTEVEKMNTSIRTRKQPRKPSMTHEKAEMPGRSREGTRNAARGGRTSSKDRKFALQQDVDRLQKKLQHEENIHRALERAFNRPLGALPRLPPYLPPYTLGLLAEVAVLEEEIVRLEEQVLHFRQNLYHESVNISVSKMKLEHSAPGNNANTKGSPKLGKLKFSQTLGNPAASTTRPSTSTTLPEHKQQKENQPWTISSKRSKQSIYKGQATKVPTKKLPMDNTSLKKHWNLPKKQQDLRLSEKNSKCLSSILLRMSTSNDIKTLKSKNCIEGTEFWDPYGILEFGKRDICSYKQLRATEAKSLPLLRLK